MSVWFTIIIALLLVLCVIWLFVCQLQCCAVMALSHCEACSVPLVKPYIRCVQCSSVSVELCLCCFGSGFEQNGHRSDHQYEVIVSYLYQKTCYCIILSHHFKVTYSHRPAVHVGMCCIFGKHTAFITIKLC